MAMVTLTTAKRTVPPAPGRSEGPSALLCHLRTTIRYAKAVFCSVFSFPFNIRPLHRLPAPSLDNTCVGRRCRALFLPRGLRYMLVS